MPPPTETLQVKLRKFGRAVRRARLARQWSQEDFAEVCVVHRTHMGAIERGEVNLSFDAQMRIARALGMTMAAMLARARV